LECRGNQKEATTQFISSCLATLHILHRYRYYANLSGASTERGVCGGYDSVNERNASGRAVEEVEELPIPIGKCHN
jgi:hypothetical protein